MSFVKASLVVLSCLVWLSVSPLWAQYQSQPNSSSPSAGQETTPEHSHKMMRGSQKQVTGCLEKGDEAGEYSLKGDDGNTYGLKSSKVELSKHVGHEVIVTGRTAKEKEEGTKEAGEKEAADINVTKLQMVSETCK